MAALWLPCGRQVSKVFFSPEEVEALDRLAKSGGFYRIRAPTSIHEQTENYVMSFVPACALIASRFTENLVFHLGKNGLILGVDMNTPNTDCENYKAPAKKSTKQKVVSTVKIDLGIEAEKPTMPAGYDEKVTANKEGAASGGGGGEGGGKKKEEEDPGIFRKYWYIWPFVLMWMMPKV